MKKKVNRKKYNVFVRTLDLKDKRKVYMILLVIRNKKTSPVHLKYDIEELSSKLGLLVDAVFGNVIIQEFDFNSNYDFNISFLPPSTDVSLSIVCKNKPAEKRLEKLIDKIKGLNKDEYLDPTY